MRLCRTCALLALLFLAIRDSSEFLQEVVQPDQGSNVTVSTNLPQCSVCIVSEVNSTEASCPSSLSLLPEVEAKLKFSCPGQSYTVTIARSTECTKDACSPPKVETQPSILTDFTRTFTWELKAPEKTVVSLSVIGGGLMEASQPCPDGYQFSVSTSKANSKGQTQYCRGGSMTRLDLPNQAFVSLQVQPKTQVDRELFQTSAGRLKKDINIDSSTTVVFSRDPEEPECEVCTTKGSTLTCSTEEKTMTSADMPSVEFSCPKPHDVFSVMIKKTIECTETSCNPPAAETDPNLLNDFKRSIIWDISVPERTVVTLDFPGDGLKDVAAGGDCSDGYKYSVSTTKSDGVIKTTSYCKGGTVSHLNVLRATTVTVEVPKGEKLESAAFNVKAAQRAGRMMSVTSGITNTKIVITRGPKEPDCSVCIDKAPNQKCSTTSQRLTNPRNTPVEFTCPHPQDVFRVEITREITSPFPVDPVSAESSLFPGFNRTFNWDMRVDFTRTFQLDFPEQGMRQIPREETCPDGHTYTIFMYLRGTSNIGNFCRGGPVTSVQVRFRGRVSLQVPVDAKLDPSEFKLSNGPETNMTTMVKVNLPRGVSDTTLMTANYPSYFLDNMQMQWNFTVPGMHNYTVHFNNFTAPDCLNGQEAMVEYWKEDNTVTKLLTDPQPERYQGDFNMVVKNCETNTTMPGLALNYGVSVMRSGRPVLCTVDLTRYPGVSLQIENLHSDSYCEMSINSEVKDKINVAAGTTAKLSFLDCPNEDVRLTASEEIECNTMASCPMTTLNVPKMESCLPMPLDSFTWHLTIPESKTWDLLSPTGSLRQSLPGQECPETFSLHLAEGVDHFVGNFCFDGVIQKVQVHANVSITAPGQLLSKTMGPILNVSVSEEIVETIIYMVSPNVMSPTLLATPNWPQGMMPYHTISWIATLPQQYKAYLKFNVTQPKCDEGHTRIDLVTLENEKQYLTVTENDKLDSMLVGQSFYLNMSNCEPETGRFGALTTIVLEKRTYLLPILLGISGVLLLLLIVLAVVCIITKKKKKQSMNRGSSIYMPKGNIFRPSDMHFTKTRSDNESHIYESIDDGMVYSHLLTNPNQDGNLPGRFNGIQVDSYHTFIGATDGALPVIKEPDPQPEDQNTMFMDVSETFIPSRPRTPIGRQDSLGFQDRRMIDNELYTFKNIGEINTIRLSCADLEPDPPITDESL